MFVYSISAGRGTKLSQQPSNGRPGDENQQLIRQKKHQSMIDSIATKIYHTDIDIFLLYSFHLINK